MAMILEDGKKCTRKRKNKVVKIAHRNDRPVNHISTPEKKKAIRKSLKIELLSVNMNCTWLVQLVWIL